MDETSLAFPKLPIGYIPSIEKKGGENLNNSKLMAKTKKNFAQKGNVNFLDDVAVYVNSNPY